jgi:exosome complex component RRP4
MGITILSPAVEDVGGGAPYDDDSIESDSDGDVHMKNVPSKRPRLTGRRDSENLGSASGVVVPGELVTDDPQWMR